MTPLGPSSLNTERARVDAGRTAPGGETGGDAAGSFAQLLQGARTQPTTMAAQGLASVPGGPPAASGRTATASGASAAGERRAAASADDAGQADRTERSDPEDSTDEDAPATRESGGGATLAHWLLHGGSAPSEAAQTPAEMAAQMAGQAGASMPAPAQPPGATDDLKAASLARQVLDAVRSRAKTAGVGKPAMAGAGPEAPVDKGGPRREQGAEASHASVPTVAASDPEPARFSTTAPAEGRFADALNAALPSAASVTPSTAPLPEASPAAAAIPVERSVATPVQDPGFGTAVGVSIRQLARDGVHEARLQLNPAELGPLSVRIAMNGQEARLELGAAHAETRALLDASLPALTEAFRADGLVLAATQVSDLPQDPRGGAGQMAGGGSASAGQGQQGGQPDRREQGAGGRPAAFETQISLPVAVGSAAVRPSGGRGGLDLYA